MKNNNLFSKVLMPFGKSGNIYLLGAIGQGLGPIILTPILTLSPILRIGRLVLRKLFSTLCIVF
jgi:hypothetical protein